MNLCRLLSKRKGSLYLKNIIVCLFQLFYSKIKQRSKSKLAQWRKTKIRLCRKHHLFEKNQSHLHTSNYVYQHNAQNNRWTQAGKTCFCFRYLWPLPITRRALIPKLGTLILLCCLVVSYCLSWQCKNPLFRTRLDSTFQV